MHSMFYANGYFKENISTWDTSSVVDMHDMFTYSQFDGDLGHWDTSNVTDMRNLFLQNNKFNQNLSCWDVSSVTDASAMLVDSTTFVTPGGGWRNTCFCSAVLSSLCRGSRR